jgi:ADP-ribose diphosphatase
MRKKPDIKKITEVARSRLFMIEQVDLRFSNGVQAQYERLAPAWGHGAVIIVALQDVETVLLIEEYSVGTESYELVLPKGRIEAGESAVAAANRELAEETGFAARQLTHISDIALAPGYMSYKTALVLAEDLYPDPREGDEPEPLIVVPWKLAQIFELCHQEGCSEGRTIAALYMVKDYIAHRNARVTREG